MRTIKTFRVVSIGRAISASPQATETTMDNRKDTAGESGPFNRLKLAAIAALAVELPLVAAAGASRMTAPVAQIAIATAATSAKRLKGRDSVVLRSSIVVSVVFGLAEIAARWRPL